MRFDYKAYDECYPRPKAVKPEIESVVETFKPSEELPEMTEEVNSDQNAGSAVADSDIEDDEENTDGIK